jgi:hypothetical protein
LLIFFLLPTVFSTQRDERYCQVFLAGEFLTFPPPDFQALETTAAHRDDQPATVGQLVE